MSKTPRTDAQEKTHEATNTKTVTLPLADVRALVALGWELSNYISETDKSATGSIYGIEHAHKTIAKVASALPHESKFSFGPSDAPFPDCAWYIGGGPKGFYFGQKTDGTIVSQGEIMKKEMINYDPLAKLPDAWIGWELEKGEVCVRVCIQCADKAAARTEAARLKCRVIDSMCAKHMAAAIARRQGEAE